MASEWDEQPLSNLCSYLNRGAAPAYTDADGVLVLNQKCVRDQRVDFSFARRTDPKKKPIAADRIIQPFDILVNSTGVGTLGRVAQIRDLPGTTTVDSHVTLVRANGEIVNPLYLGFALRCFESEIEALGQGSTGQTELSRTRLGEFRVPIPTRPSEQHAIAETLGSLDDRIENLRQINTTLEAIAAALFKSWFVDFDGVAAEDMQESELGLIPKGWRVGTLDQALEINPRRALAKGAVAPYLDMASVPTVGPVPDAPLMREFSSGAKFIDGDTLVARITPCLENGKTAFVACLGDEQTGWGSTEFIVLRPKLPLPPFFAYLLARRADFRAHAIQAMTGTSGRQRVEVGQLQKYRLAIPDEATAKAFAAVVEPIQKSLFGNAAQMATLAELRDTLLPRLISGRLRIDDARERAEAVPA